MQTDELSHNLVPCDEADLSRCAGIYGKRKFFISKGELFYGHLEFSLSWKILPMTKTRFRLDEDVKFEFLMDRGGRASEVKIYYTDGRPEEIASRTG